jgi:pyranose oxidase
LLTLSAPTLSGWRVAEHERASDSLSTPFTDSEPQVTVSHSSEHPYYVQIHRDGDVGPEADLRLIVDFHFFGEQDVKDYYRVYFGPAEQEAIPKGWVSGITDSYGH